MRIIVAGSRTFANLDWIDGVELVRSTVESSLFTTNVIVSGGADGIDTFAEMYAEEEDLPLVVYEAEWDKYLKAAGPKRNIRMAQNADALVAIWDGKSTGTHHMIKTAKKRGLKIYVHIIQTETRRRKANSDFARQMSFYSNTK